MPRDTSAPARARALVRQLLGARQIDLMMVEDSSLVASELVTNALKHGKGTITLLLRVQRSNLLIEVVDEGEHPERVRRRPSDSRGGWGLHLVESLAARWGVYEGTTHVWAEIAL